MDFHVSEVIALLAVAAVVVAAFGELIWARRNDIDTYSPKETLASLGTAAINRAGSALSLGWKFLVFEFFEELTPLSIPTNAATAVIGFLLADMVYYWWHRLSHEIPALWTLHFVHHSSPEYNLLVAPRLSAPANFVSPALFIPLILIGFTPKLITVSLAVGLFYQFFIHTEAVGRLGPLEGWINTPSAHRVHHGTNRQYIDKNYGGALSVWDRIFGTYEPEVEKVRYGVTTGHWGYNPIRLQFGPLWMLLTGGGWTREKKNAENMGTSPS